jgi:hypothetical protein
MKKIFPLIMVVTLMCSSSFAQKSETTASSSTKHSQTTLYNEVYAGYGGLSIFYFTGRMKHSGDFPTEYISNSKFTEPQSVGNFFIGYSRSLNSVVSIGMKFGYQSFTYSGTGLYPYSPDSAMSLVAYDRLVTGIARVTFCYLNKPAVRIYSGIGIGLTIDFGKVTVNGFTTSERKLWPGGELTLMGLRFGRAFGGFVEFGFGSYGIVDAGLSYKFSD